MYREPQSGLIPTEVLVIMIGFPAITRCTKDLKVVQVIRTTSGARNDVIDLQDSLIGTGSAKLAAPVTLQNVIARGLRNRIQFEES